MGTDYIKNLPDIEESFFSLVDKVLKDLFVRISHMNLQRCPKYDVGAKDMCTVYTRFYGGYKGWIALCAERSLMKRIVEQMMEGPVTDSAEIAEGVEEFFNIFCGHFVSSVFAKTELAARFHTPCFIEGGHRLEKADEKMIVRHYTNEHAETASLLYTRYLSGGQQE